MNLLLDQNLSHLLVDRLKDIFPGATHVRLMGLERAKDEAVWNYAREYEFALVSKDADFYQRSFLYAAPPKVIWIQRGNCATDDIEKIMRTHQADILRFLDDPQTTFLILT